MSNLTIFSVPGSPYGRMPLMACLEKGVPYRYAPMALGDNQTAEWLARHPFGRIPAIDHDGFSLYESQAIVRYIDQAFDGPPLTPAAPRAAARMSQIMNIVDWYVMPSLSSGIGWNRVVAPMFNLPVDEDAVTAAIPLARTSVKALGDLLGTNRYMVGDEISLADIMLYPHIEFAPQSPEGAELLEGSPLLDWLDRMNARPSAQATTMSLLMARAQEMAEPSAELETA